MSQDSTRAAALDIPDRITPATKPGFGGMLCAVLLISIVIDAFFFTGFYSSDDQTYYAAARQYVQEGSYPALNVGSMRLPMVGWSMLVILVCGPHVQAVALSYVLFHQLINVLGYFIVKRVYDARAGLLAAYLLAMFPLLIIYSSMLLPDLQLTCGCALALLCYLGWRDGFEKKPFRAWLLFFACGVSVGLAYMAKEAALILLPFFFVAWLTSFKRSRVFFTLVQGLAFAIGFFAILGIEYLLLSHLAGEPVVRLTWTTEPISSAVQSSVNKYGLHPLTRLQWVGRRLDEDVWPFALKALVLLSLVVFPFIRRRRWSLLLLPVWIFSFQVWGTMHFRSYTPPTIQARYFITIVPFCMAILAIVAFQFYDWCKSWSHSTFWQRWLRRLACAVVVLAPLLGLKGPDRQAGKAYKADIVGNVASAINATSSRKPTAPVVVSATLSNYMKMLVDPNNTTYLPAYSIHDEELLKTCLGDHFYFIALAPERLIGERKWSRSSRIDAILRPIISQTANPLNRALPDPVVTYRNLVTPDKGIVRYPWGDCEFTAVVTASYDQFPSRTAQVIAELGHLPPGSITLPDPGSRTVIAYRIDVNPIHLETKQSTSPTSAPAESAIMTENVVYDLVPQLLEWKNDKKNTLLRNWGVANDTDHHSFKAVDDGWQLDTTLSSNKYLWLWPISKKIKRDRFVLESQRLYEIVIDAKIEGKSLRVELLSEAYDPNQLKKARNVSRAWLNNGHNVLGFYTENAEACFWPKFKLFGTGTFRINTFQIRDAEQPIENVSSAPGER